MKKQQNILNRQAWVITIAIIILTIGLVSRFQNFSIKPSTTTKKHTLTSPTTQQQPPSFVYNILAEEVKQQAAQTTVSLQSSNLLRKSLPVRLNKASEYYDKRRFDTTVYQTYTAFDKEKFIYYLISASIHYPNSIRNVPNERFATISVYYLDNGEKRYAEGNLSFTKVTPSYCVFYSFLDTSGSLFLSCLKESDTTNNRSTIFLLGLYSKRDKSATNNNKSLLIPYYYNEFVVNSKLLTLGTDYIRDKQGNYTKTLSYQSPLQIVEVRGTKFYLVFSQRINILALRQNQVGEPTLKDKTTIELRYNNENNYGENAAPFSKLSGKNQSITPPLLNFIGSRYLLFADGKLGGGIIDVINDNQLKVDSSCFQTFDRNKYPLSYIGVIHPFVSGPYSNTHLRNFNPTTQTARYEQGYCSGGGCVKEGVILMRFTSNKVTCKITPTFTESVVSD